MAAGKNAVLNRPNCTHANGFYANVLHFCGEHETALHHIELAMRYSPMHPPLFKDILAAIYRALGNFGLAAETAQAAIASHQGDLIARLILASLAVKRDDPQAWELITQDICCLDATFSIARFAESQPYQSKAFLQEFASEFQGAGLPE